MSDYIANPIKKVLSVRIYLPAGTFRGGQLKKPPYTNRDPTWTQKVKKDPYRDAVPKIGTLFPTVPIVFGFHFNHQDVQRVQSAIELWDSEPRVYIQFRVLMLYIKIRSTQGYPELIRNGTF